MGFPEKAYIQGVDGQKKKVEFLINPSEYSVSRSISYRRAESKGSDVPPLEFVTGEGRRLTFELLLDGYEKGENVQRFVKELEALANVDRRTEGAAKKPRPQVVRFGWGHETLFNSLIKSLDVSYILFHPDGRPARAKVKLTLEEVPEQLSGQNPTSLGDPERHGHVVLPGETLDQIAYQELGSAALWTHIAETNHIDNPFELRAGQRLVIEPVA